MGRNEIRLRRQKMSSGRIAQHRNYGDLMARHERDTKIRRVVKVFIYFLIILFLLIIFMIVNHWEETQTDNQSVPSTARVISDPPSGHVKPQPIETIPYPTNYKN